MFIYRVSGVGGQCYNIQTKHITYDMRLCAILRVGRFCPKNMESEKMAKKYVNPEIFNVLECYNLGALHYALHETRTSYALAMAYRDGISYSTQRYWIRKVEKRKRFSDSQVREGLAAYNALYTRFVQPSFWHADYIQSLYQMTVQLENYLSYGGFTILAGGI